MDVSLQECERTTVGARASLSSFAFPYLLEASFIIGAKAKATSLPDVFKEKLMVTLSRNKYLKQECILV